MVKREVRKPPAEQLAIALLTAEKSARKTKPVYRAEQLEGTWRLCFITGTKKAQDRAGMVLRSGRYLPSWVTIELTYLPQGGKSGDKGILENCIQFGWLQLKLTGPAKFLTPKNILVFDFTQLSLKLGQQTLYSGQIRGGSKRQEMFEDASLKTQAFFTYFLITDNLIAARGKGGGLAIWGSSRSLNSDV